MNGITLHNLRVEGPEGALLRDVDLALNRGEVLGLVGSSGAGKTMVASALAGLTPPPAKTVSGTLRLGGKPLNLADDHGMAKVRGRGVFMIMQSAAAALDPTMRIQGQLGEAMDPVGRRERRAKAAELLASVGLGTEVLRAYPSQLSGGMRQRVQIAMALALRPRLLIADEPTTGLDAITQAAILKELAELPRRTGGSMIFIGHDFRVVAALAQNIAVLDAGRIAECGPSREVFLRPAHRVTRRLLEAAIG